jgi:hypothetical protein
MHTDSFQGALALYCALCQQQQVFVNLSYLAEV